MSKLIERSFHLPKIMDIGLQAKAKEDGVSPNDLFISFVQAGLSSLEGQRDITGGGKISSVDQLPVPPMKEPKP